MIQFGIIINVVQLVQLFLIHLNTYVILFYFQTQDEQVLSDNEEAIAD